MNDINTNNKFLELCEDAKAAGINPARYALMLGANADLNTWPDINDNATHDTGYAEVDLHNDDNNDILSKLSRSVATSIQFPVNTVYLHGLGVMASAMTRSFTYKYHGELKPVNLYVVTAQPPSTGKSGVNNVFSRPVRNAYTELNKINEKKRSKLTYQFEMVLEDLKQATQQAEKEKLANDAAELKEKIDSTYNYVYATDDATPEALENIACSQGGMFNIVSDEADAIDIILGNVYSDAKANHGLMLKGWDGDFHSPARITRKTNPGYVRGSIAVIAQDTSIESLLVAGQSGRGISERILMLREKPLLGYRNMESYTPICTSLRTDYDNLIMQVVQAGETTLTFTNESMNMIMQYRQDCEEHLRDDGKYSNTMLRGAVGKADKQILKIACVLHVSECWNAGNTPLRVSDKTMAHAIHVYSELVKTYVSAADSQGFAGSMTELEDVKRSLIKYADKRKYKIGLRQIRDNVKKNKAFKGLPKPTLAIKAALNSLEKMGYCVFMDDEIYISPKIK